jgi:hypothetical protein
MSDNTKQRQAEDDARKAALRLLAELEASIRKRRGLLN